MIRDSETIISLSSFHSTVTNLGLLITSGHKQCLCAYVYHKTALRQKERKEEKQK